jgi:LPXTG-site transpeptidase (sortase) family protein
MVPQRSRLRSTAAAALLVVGAMLLTVSGGYYAYAAWARSGVDDLNVELARPTGLQTPSIDAPSMDVSSFAQTSEALQIRDAGETIAESASVAPSAQTAAPDVASAAYQDTEAKSNSAGDAEVAITTDDAAPAQNLSRNADLGAGAAISPETLDRLDDEGTTSVALASTAASAPWVEASTAEAALYTPILTDGPGLGDLPPATRIRIPALELDSHIAELAIVRTDNSASWETPKHVVGHIPTTANAGSGGQGWYFGHLESPIRGEGSVFRRLPEVTQLLKEDPDRPVYVFLESVSRSFAYRIYNVEVVSQEDLEVSDSGTHDITLVTCTPRFVYDQRLLVTAALIGVLES